MRGFSLTLTLSRWERRIEGSPGPLDNGYLFDGFIEMVRDASDDSRRDILPDVPESQGGVPCVITVEK